ncbi:MAG: addiction module antidote protein, HigA family [Parcubacteria group bacterium CG11_big_fil_rev_8_21_14_0_20_41_14]|nr:MAG: addiction module antidote protein, HigA family [Parcubacteria group bacterium CG11_big_fil_rev_8_21_14_0_20_41_14]
MKRKKLQPIHPGEILLKEFLQPFAISQYRLAKDIYVPPRRINEIIHGTRSITTDTAFRLAKYFNTTPQLWIGLQTQFEIETYKDSTGDAITKKIKTLNHDCLNHEERI